MVFKREDIDFLVIFVSSFDKDILDRWLRINLLLIKLKFVLSLPVPFEEIYQGSSAFQVFKGQVLPSLLLGGKVLERFSNIRILSESLILLQQHDKYL